MCGCKRLRAVVCVMLVCIFFCLPVVQAQAPDELYLQQETGNSCTLCASTMMIRSLMYHAGSEDWKTVTESDVRSTAWTSAGLSWSWTYEISGNTVTIGHKSVGGISRETLTELLKDHPEGIVLYCGGSAPHAVFVTDCTDDVFYCADSAATYSGQRIPLSESLLGDRHGGQSSILANTTAYWYIADSEIILPEPAREVCPPIQPGDEMENVPARL